MRKVLWAALAAGALALAGTSAARADDVIRLGGSYADSGDGTKLVHGRGGFGGYRGGFGVSVNVWRGGYGGFYRPHYGGFYRPYYGGYYGGYRPYYGGYYGGYYGVSTYAPYYSYPVYSAYSYGLAPCASQVVMPQVVTSSPAITTVPDGSYVPQETTPYMPPAAGGAPSTFPYDGGPAAPLPMPGAGSDTDPSSTPNRPYVPRDGRLVSLPATTSGLSYAPAFDSDLYRVSYRPAAAVPTRQAPPAAPAATKTSTPRYSYPAYGEHVR